MATSAAPRASLDDEPDRKVEPVTERELLAIIDDEIRAGITFENDDGKDSRSTALDYCDGIMADIKPEEGRSAVVSRDCSDIIHQVMPGLMRVFGGAGRLGVYQPNRESDQEIAAQATDYVNHVFENECNGFLVIQTWILDALQTKNGVLKVYWDASVEYKVDQSNGLTIDTATLLLEELDARGDTIIGIDSRQEMAPGADGQSIPVEVFDIRYRRTVREGRMRVENVPGEDFGISKGALDIETAPWVWHTRRMTRSDLLRHGYDPKVVDGLPAWGREPRGDDSDRQHRRRESASTSREKGATAEIEVVEAYGFVDFDGDGIAEGRKVVLAGGGGREREILENVEWPDDRPFVSITPNIVPHQWLGRSIPDDVMDLQKVKTALMRAALDNTYAQSFPDRMILERAIINPDEVRSRKFGRLIRVKEAGAVQDLTVPFTAAQTMQTAQFVDGMMVRRTGISPSTPSLDNTALDPQTATAEQLEHDASYASTELIARNMAETGFRALFGKMLRILIRNQDRPRTLRLRDKWTEYDPRAWNAGMDVTVNIGHGTGSRERDVAMLRQILAMQMQVVQELGPDNPIVTPSMIVATQHKIVEASGMREAEAYFKPVSDDDFKAWMEQRPKPGPDPKVQAIEAKAQADQQKAEAQVGLAREKAQADIMTDREKAQAEMQLERERMQAEFALAQEKMNREFQIRQQEMRQETELRLAQFAAGLGAPSTNIPRQ